MKVSGDGTICKSKDGDRLILRTLPSGQTVTDFRVATYSHKNKEGKAEKSFWTLEVWGELANNVVASLKAGDQIVFNGFIKDDSYEKDDGTTVQKSKVNVDAIGPSLRFNTASITNADAYSKAEEIIEDVFSDKPDQEAPF
jgi:single-strand DNA-binding protein|tara:strand:+ start:319 stop:741 length:423 start_codon:yes stop_codon:yes gene_type:complete